MRIATFNVNSIRARLPRLLEWLESASPDVVALQETKVADDLFPRTEIEGMGYEIAMHGQPQRHGVAFLSKLPIENVVSGYLEGWASDCRAIRADIAGIRVINTYVPNGTAVGTDKWDYKMQWLEAFNSYVSSFASASDPVMWLGDINIAPFPEDVHNHKSLLGQVGHHPDEFARLDAIKAWGWTELLKHYHPEDGVFSFWDFRVPKSLERNLGWRIDHVYVTEALGHRHLDCFVDRDVRGKERPSDHAPVICDLKD